MRSSKQLLGLYPRVFGLYFTIRVRVLSQYYELVRDLRLFKNLIKPSVLKILYVVSFIMLFVAARRAFHPNTTAFMSPVNKKLKSTMPSIAEGVNFDTVAREWRAKVSHTSHALTRSNSIWDLLACVHES